MWLVVTRWFLRNQRSTNATYANRPQWASSPTEKTCSSWGPPGVGKTHLAIALGDTAVQHATSVYFTTMVDLLDQPYRDAKEDRLAHRLHTVHRPKLLSLDEMGYFALNRMTAQFLFQLGSRRYGRGSIILTSNKSYSEQDDLFVDQILAAAILDRLLHFSTTSNIRGQSYRLHEKRKAGVFAELPAPSKADCPRFEHLICGIPTC